MYVNICLNTIVEYEVFYYSIFRIILFECIYGNTDWQCTNNNSLLTDIPSVILLREFFMFIFISVNHQQIDFCWLYLPYINVDFLLFMIDFLSLWMIGKRSERDYSQCYTDCGIVCMQQYFQKYAFHVEQSKY